MRVLAFILIAFLLVSPLQALAAGGEAIAVLEQKVLDAKRALKDLDYETIDRLLQDLKEGRGTEETTGLIDDLLIESLAVETRAIWLDSVHLNTLTSREKIAEAMDLLASINVNVILVDIFGNGHSVFPSKVAEQRDAFRFLAEGDIVPILIEEAHLRGIEFHALASLFGVDSYGIGPFMDDRLHWFDRTKDGGILTGIGDFEAFFSPVLPEVREFFLEVIKEILTYDIDGLHLDYIRFGRNVGYHPYTLQLHKEAGGVPENLDDPKEMERFTEFRSSFISSFVDEVRILMQETKPGLLLSAAVGSNLTDAQREICQDWHDWAERRLLHLIFHMCYVETSAQYQVVIDNDPGAIKDLAISFPGIALYAVDGKELLHQLEVGQTNPVSGQALFSTVHLKPELVEVLGKVWRRPAMPTFRDPLLAAKSIIENLRDRFTGLGSQIGIDSEVNQEIVLGLGSVAEAIASCNLRPWDSRDLQEGSLEELEQLEQVLSLIRPLKRLLSKREPPTRERALSDLQKAERLIQVLRHYAMPI